VWVLLERVWVGGGGKEGGEGRKRGGGKIVLLYFTSIHRSKIGPRRFHEVRQ
jgi:hypothetical protein